MSTVGRKALGLTLLLTLLIGLLAPVSSAQTNTKVFQVAATITPGSTTIVERFGSIEMTLNITVVETTENPIADQAQIEIVITRDRPQPAPNGWAVSEIVEPTFTLASNQRSATRTFTVSLTSEDPDPRPVQLQYTVRARPIFGSPGSPLDPLTGAVSGNQESTARADASVRRELEPAEALTSFVFINAWLLAAAAAAILVIVGVLLRGRRRSGVSIATDSPMQEVVPGRGASFPVVITNLGSDKESVVLGTSEVPTGWSAILPVERLELRGNESTTIWLTLKSPPNARPGESIQVAFIATGSDGGATEVRLEAAVVERYGDAPATQIESVRATRGAMRAR